MMGTSILSIPWGIKQVPRSIRPASTVPLFAWSKAAAGASELAGFCCDRCSLNVRAWELLLTGRELKTELPVFVFVPPGRFHSRDHYTRRRWPADALLLLHRPQITEGHP